VSRLQTPTPGAKASELALVLSVKRSSVEAAKRKGGQCQADAYSHGMGRGQGTQTATHSMGLRNERPFGASGFTTNLDGMTDVDGNLLSGDYTFQTKVMNADGTHVHYQFAGANGELRFLAKYPHERFDAQRS
jgi:hypothetical protein